MLGEHVRGVEPKVDLIMAAATDFVRADPDYDAVLVVARAARSPAYFRYCFNCGERLASD